MSDAAYLVNITYGTVELQTRIVPIDGGEALAGEGRTIHRDRLGEITKTTEWERSGAVLRFGANRAVKPWWKFWE